MIFQNFKLQRIQSCTKMALEAKKNKAYVCVDLKDQFLRKLKICRLLCKSFTQDSLPPKTICKQLGISRAYSYHLKKQDFDTKKHC